MREAYMRGYREGRMGSMATPEKDVVERAVCVECGEPALARDLCTKHYWRHRRAGTLPPTLRQRAEASSMTDPAAASDAVRAALERLLAAVETNAIQVHIRNSDLDAMVRLAEAVEQADAALRLPAAAPVDPKILAEAMERAAGRLSIGFGPGGTPGWKTAAMVTAEEYNRLAGQSSSQPVGGEDHESD
jgi:hypothetical protein